jgi:hypothetical protein|tara:strand:+ start:188 stop:1000 length:813 start_codon:yes stop_codon:yes gene_type:complete
MSNYSAISAICKNEEEYIIEWLEYHLSLGIDSIFLFDNYSDKPLHDITHTYQKYNVHTYLWDKTQRESQRHCLNYNKHFRWIGLLDIDEYVVLLEQETNINNYLKRYEDYDGLCLHWLMFGSNNHKTKQQSTIQSYTQSCPNIQANTHVKSFINPQNYLYEHKTPHWMPTKNGSVNVLYQQVNDPFGAKKYEPVIDRVMRINHYYTRSYQDFFENKKLRGSNAPKEVYRKKDYKSVQKESIYNEDIIKFCQKQGVSYGTQFAGSVKRLVD